MTTFLKWTISFVMQLYIATYFICKIFIGESVYMLRTLHKMLRTLHSVNLIYQNCKIYAFILLQLISYLFRPAWSVNSLSGHAADQTADQMCDFFTSHVE